MGFFKKLGKSIKGVTKMISIKNVGKVVAGDATGLGKELAGRLATPFVAKSSSVQEIVNSQPVQMLDTAIQARSIEVNQKATDSMAKSKEAKTSVDFFNKFFTQVYWKTNWELYKVWIVGIILLIIGLVIWKRSNKPKGARVAKRR